MNTDTAHFTLAPRRVARGVLAAACGAMLLLSGCRETHKLLLGLLPFLLLTDLGFYVFLPNQSLDLAEIIAQILERDDIEESLLNIGSGEDLTILDPEYVVYFFPFLIFFSFYCY